MLHLYQFPSPQNSEENVLQRATGLLAAKPHWLAANLGRAMAATGKGQQGEQGEQGEWRCARCGRPGEVRGKG